jgi:hypothetical protein
MLRFAKCLPKGPRQFAVTQNWAKKEPHWGDLKDFGYLWLLGCVGTVVQDGSRPFRSDHKTEQRIVIYSDELCVLSFFMVLSSDG